MSSRSKWFFTPDELQLIDDALSDTQIRRFNGELKNEDPSYFDRMKRLQTKVIKKLNSLKQPVLKRVTLKDGFTSLGLCRESNVVEITSRDGDDFYKIEGHSFWVPAREYDDIKEIV